VDDKDDVAVNLKPSETHKRTKGQQFVSSLDRLASEIRI